MSFDPSELNRGMETIRVEGRGGVVTLTLDRPDRLNALGPDMLPELLEALEAIRRSRDVKVLVLTGAGRGFCAGVDLSTPFFLENVETDSVFDGTRLLDWQHEVILALHELPQPTIALINGAAVGGGGLGMAMACDMRFSIAAAQFWMIPGQLNVVQDFGLTWLLQRCIGMPRTMELVFSGRRIQGDEAMRIGMVNESFTDPEDLRRHVDSVTSTIAGMGSDACRMLKMVVRHGSTSPLRDQLRVEAVANGLCFSSEEFKRAKASLLEGLNKR